eukprot:GCRY01002802.1.p1 GENE.GCRY01002802.1~~GCRY01002802.1.p1  ORF type:complete len:337 (+),score=37.49 GCRY01002802.1:183-1193(+)
MSSKSGSNGKLCRNCKKRAFDNPLEKLCSKCIAKLPSYECIYCHLDFHQISTDKEAKKPFLCRHCCDDFQLHGKPSRCDICELSAAFGTNSYCRQCEASRKKYGNPIQCNGCLKQCAFEKSADSKQKVDHYTLCLRCTRRYKKNRRASGKMLTLPFAQFISQSTIKPSLNKESANGPKQNDIEAVQNKGGKSARKRKTRWDTDSAVPVQTAAPIEEPSPKKREIAVAEVVLPKKTEQQTPGKVLRLVEQLQEELGEKKKESAEAKKLCLAKQVEVSQLNGRLTTLLKEGKQKMDDLARTKDEMILQLRTENKQLAGQIKDLEDKLKKRKEAETKPE